MSMPKSCESSFSDSGHKKVHDESGFDIDDQTDYFDEYRPDDFTNSLHFGSNDSKDSNDSFEEEAHLTVGTEPSIKNW
jgi:hypothetical protein